MGWEDKAAMMRNRGERCLRPQKGLGGMGRGRQRHKRIVIICRAKKGPRGHRKTRSARTQLKDKDEKLTGTQIL